MRLKFFFTFIFSLILLLELSASSTKEIPAVDSLKQLINNSKDTYTLIKANSQLCWIKRSRDPENAMAYGNKALQLINKNPQYDSIKAEVLNFLGVVNRNKGNYGGAMDYYFEALEQAKKHNDYIQIAYSNNNLGGIFTMQGNYIDAIEYIKSALHYFSKENHLKGIGYTYVNLGNLYRYAGETDEGIRCLNQAIIYKEKVNDTIGIAITKNLIAIALFDKGDFDEAHILYTQLQDLYRINKDIKGLSVVKNYLGLLETKDSNYQRAIQFFKESIKLSEHIQNKYGIALAKIDMAIPYHKLGQTIKALKILDEGSLLAREIGDLELIIDSYENYARIYHGLGNYKLAYDYKTKYQESLEKHLDNLTRERIASLRINTELEKKKNQTEYLENRTLLLEENVVLAEEKLLLQRYFVASLVIIILLILIPLFVLIRKNKNKLDRNEDLIGKNIQLQEANKTRERFLSIIGHDLKNPFNSVLGLTGLLIDEWDALPDKEKLYILNEIHSSSNSIYELMDNLLLWAKNQSGTIQVHPERININDNIIEAYEIFRNQASYKKIEIKLNIGSSNYISADPQMINTILRNLFSNALKFTKKNGDILIDVQRLTSEIKVSITDNGKGIPPDDLKKILDDRGGFSTKGTADESGTGLGLLVVRDFVKGNKGVFWVESTEGVGSTFCFTLPDHKI